jgi:hypothetical protein
MYGKMVRVCATAFCAGLIGVAASCGSDDDDDSDGAPGGGAGRTGSGGDTASGGEPSGGGSGGAASGADPYESDWPGDTVLDELSEEEYREACEQVQEYMVQRFTGPGCALAGAMAALEAEEAQMVVVCQIAVLACNAEPDLVRAQLPDMGDCSKPEDCTATVEEMEDCVNVFADSVSAALGAVPECSEVTPDMQVEIPEEAFSDPAEAEACVTFSENCPGALESWTGVGTGGSGGSGGGSGGGAGQAGSGN